MRKAKERKDSSRQIKLTYPKFKDGEATVRDVKEKQNFGIILTQYSKYPFNYKLAKYLNENYLVNILMF